MGTLYVTSLPVGERGADDVTFRALRCLREATLVVSADLPRARTLLDRLGVAAPLAPSTDLDSSLTALAKGDVVLLLDGALAGPAAAAQTLIQSVLSTGRPVVPLPGAVLPITALAVSGLPASSFVYLGSLPETDAGLGALMAPVASERRTLVAVAARQRLAGLWAALYSALGDRPVVMTLVPDAGSEAEWRGRLAAVPEALPASGATGTCVLVIGGAPGEVVRWEEGRLRAEIRARLSRGAGAREVSRQLAAESGWPRRDVYRLVVHDFTQDHAS